MNFTCRYDLKGFANELGLPLKDMADLFSELIKEITAELLEARNILASGNLESLKQINHNLKGISANYRIQDLYEQTCKISNALKSNCDNQTLQSLFNNLFLTFESTVQEIIAYFAHEGIDISQ